MPSSVQELTGTLLAAVDSEGNVRDMAVVLNVVSLLEKRDVTAEDLKTTRLGKHINLIRRKVADVDRQLAKRLKSLVKHWQHLLLSKAPNGIVPPGGAQPADHTPSQPLTSAQATVEAHSTLSVQTAPSLVTNPATGERISHVRTSSSPSKSLLASSDVVLNSSEGPPTIPPSSPSPSNTPAPANPSRNRFKIMQKLSSLKKAPAALPFNEPSPSQPVTTNLLHPAITEQPSTGLPPPSSGSLDSFDGQEGISLAGNTTWTPDDAISKSLWTAGSFTDMIPEDFSNGSSWVPPLSPEELGNHTFTDTTSACNGGNRTDFQRTSSVKRPRSPSPADTRQSLHPHKRHKKNSSKRAKRELQRQESAAEYVVRIPLDKVCVGGVGKGLTGDYHGYHQPGLTDIQKEEVEGYRGLSSDHRGLTEKHSTAATRGIGEVSLVVSIRRSLLSRVPATVKGAPDELSPVVHPAALESGDKTLQSHDKISQSHDSAYQSYDQRGNAFPEKHEPMDTDAGVEKENSVLVPVVQQRPPPEGVCPGVDGCIGSDGYWYEWTEHIKSHDAEVTVMPYVYYEDCNTP